MMQIKHEGYKKAFFRVFFGNNLFNPSERSISDGSIGRMQKDLALLKINSFEQKSKIPIFVFGEQNRDILIDMGFSVIMIEKKPLVFDFNNMLLHKLIAFDIASQLFDEAIMLDIDCQQIAEFPVDFWESHRERANIQIPLYRRREDKAPVEWRTAEHKHLLPCSCYVYFRDRKKATPLMHIAEKMDKMGFAIYNDEFVFARMLDIENGGEQTSYEDYIKNYEPKYCHRWTRRMNEHGFPPLVFKHYIRDSEIKRSLKKNGLDCSSPEALLKGLLRH